MDYFLVKFCYTTIVCLDCWLGSSGKTRFLHFFWMICYTNPACLTLVDRRGISGSICSSVTGLLLTIASFFTLWTIGQTIFYIVFFQATPPLTRLMFCRQTGEPDEAGGGCLFRLILHYLQYPVLLAVSALEHLATRIVKAQTL